MVHVHLVINLLSQLINKYYEAIHFSASLLYHNFINIIHAAASIKYYFSSIA